LYAQLSGHWRMQANLENLLDRHYAASAHNNNNILPGAPRTIRLSLAAEF
jgi:catecholate siderophore receptor